MNIRLPTDIVNNIVSFFNKDDLEMCCYQFDNYDDVLNMNSEHIWALNLRLINKTFKHVFEKYTINMYDYRTNDDDELIEEMNLNENIESHKSTWFTIVKQIYGLVTLYLHRTSHDVKRGYQKSVKINLKDMYPIRLRLRNKVIHLKSKYFSQIKHQSRQICLYSVKRDWSTLQYVKKQDKDICLCAVRKDVRLLEIVKEQDKEICFPFFSTKKTKAVRKDGYALKFVREQDKQICLEAVRQNGGALQLVKEQDKDICLEAVRQNGCALKYVNKQDKETCLEAIRQSYYAFGYVKEQYREDCEFFLSKKRRNPFDDLNEKQSKK